MLVLCGFCVCVVFCLFLAGVNGYTKLDCEETRPLSMKAKRSARNRFLMLSVFMGNQNSFNRTFGVYVKHLLRSHVKHVVQETGVQKKDLKMMTWIDRHTQTCILIVGVV